MAPAPELGSGLVTADEAVGGSGAGASAGGGGPDRRRWAVAAVMIWIGCNQAVVWMTFSASAKEVRSYWPSVFISDAELNVLLNWGPISYLIAVWFFLLRMAKLGQHAVHSCVLWSAALIAAGAVLRCVPFFVGDAEAWAPRAWLHAGQFLSGLGGPVSAAVAPAFAAAWFPPGERTLATSLVWTCQSLAPSAGFLAALALPSRAGLRAILLFEAVSSVLALLLWRGFVPKLPERAPSASAAAQREATCAALAPSPASPSSSPSSPLVPPALGPELLNALRQHRFWLLAVSGGVSVGAFQCWSSSLGVVFADRPLPGFGAGLDVGVLLALVGNLGCFVGTVASATLAERYFHRRFKAFLILASALQCVLLVIFALTVLRPSGGGALEASVQLAALLAASVLSGLGAPVCFELGAELTYPAPEGLSASAYSFTVNGGGFFIMTALSGADLKAGATCMLMAGIVGLGLLLLLPVEEAYPRLALDDEAATASEALRGRA